MKLVAFVTSVALLGAPFAALAQEPGGSLTGGVGGAGGSPSKKLAAAPLEDRIPVAPIVAGGAALAAGIVAIALGGGGGGDHSTTSTTNTTSQ